MNLGDPLPRSGYVRRTISEDYMFYLRIALDYHRIAQPDEI